jgi:uncharacterized SAM-binding protein YcdF (DUF218 family)
LAFLYSLLLRLLYPTSLSVLLLLTAAAAGRRPRLRRVCFALALVILVVCGNGWLTSAMIRRLERTHLPAASLPAADAILVLSGGILSRTPPRPTVEVGEAGDRVLYGAELFRQHKAPQIICTGNVGTGGISARPASEDMAELLAMVGIPSQAVVVEVRSENTHEHAVNLCPMLRDRQIKSVLLVTSAMHMPRALASFQRECPTIVFTPAPTDFRVVDGAPLAWHRWLVRAIPTPATLLDFSDAAHEYLGLLYYRMRGWV